MTLFLENLNLVAFLVAALYVGAAVCAVREVLYGRTSQGSIGWLLSLFFFPYVTFFLYLAFGWKRLDDYVRLRRRAGPGLDQTRIVGFDSDLRIGHKDEKASSTWPLLANISQLPFLSGNDVRILVNGRETYASMFEGIRAAKQYVLLQFYIIRDDGIGNELADLLIEKAREGIRILLLYDDIGSAGLPRRFLRRLENEGITVSGFNRSRPMLPLARPFRINFRNHRKIVIVDGETAWVGGLNVGDEYLGRSEQFEHWRDTHVRVKGPAALATQVSYAEDWHWATGSTLPLEWPSAAVDGNGAPVLVMSSGPADVIETCPIAFTEAIGRARKRVWIVSPYFVPGEDIQTALAAAVMRGVDVRLLIPLKPDNRFVGLATSSFAEAMSAQGVHTYYYRAGFLHQKVVLIDEDLASVGTVNFDNRSFHINFEITLWFTDRQTIAFIERMLEGDFSLGVEWKLKDFEARPLWTRVTARFARLFAPIL